MLGKGILSELGIWKDHMVMGAWPLGAQIGESQTIRKPTKSKGLATLIANMTGGDPAGRYQVPP